MILFIDPRVLEKGRGGVAYAHAYKYTETYTLL